jgi:hypothetical protein
MRIRSLVAVMLVLSACGAPRYAYVRNSGLRTAFRVPSEWTTYDKATLLGQGPGPEPDTPDPIEWLVGFDADPAPSVEHVLNPDRLNTDFPQGVALVQEFSWTDRDGSSYSSLRNYLFPVDMLLQDESSAAVLSYDDTVNEKGIRGIHIVFQFRHRALEKVASKPPQETDVSEQLQRGGLGGTGAALLTQDFVTVNQVALVDPTTSRAYVFVALCSAACYERHRGDIESAVDSWVVIP